MTAVLDLPLRRRPAVPLGYQMPVDNPVRPGKYRSGAVMTVDDLTDDLTVEDIAAAFDPRSEPWDATFIRRVTDQRLYVVIVPADGSAPAGHGVRQRVDDADLACPDSVTYRDSTGQADRATSMRTWLDRAVNNPDYQVVRTIWLRDITEGWDELIRTALKRFVGGEG